MNHTPQQICQALEEAYQYAAQWVGKGKMPDFIPALEHEDPRRISVCVTDLEGNTYTAGSYQGRFSLQSISKIILLEQALQDSGEEVVFSRVGVEPSGTSFNSVYRLELIEKVPANPLINPGAIASASCLTGRNKEEKYQKFRALAGELLNDPTVDYDPVVCDCEMKTGYRNRALASMMLHNGVYTGDPEEYLELYYRGCALRVTAAQVSYFGAVLAGEGLCPKTGRRLLSREHSELYRALMATCGMYNTTGRYAVRVGIPGKSGSGGGIVAAARGKMGLGVYGPELDGNGNSVCGMKALEYLSRALDLRSY